MQDGGAGWSNFGVGVDYRRRVVTEDAFANSATLRLVQTPGGVVTKALGGTHTNTATIFTTLYAERHEVDGEYLNPSSSRIYSFAIDETAEVDGANVVTPVHFFVPYNDATLGAGFTNIVAGTVKVARATLLRNEVNNMKAFNQTVNVTDTATFEFLPAPRGLTIFVR